MSDLILIKIGTNAPRGKAMKQSALGVRRSNI